MNNSIIVDVINLPQQTDDATVVENISDECQSIKSVTEAKEEKESLCEPSTRKRKLHIKTIEFNLKEILSKTAFGNSLLLINEHGRNITSQCQSILCDIITSYFLNLNITYVFLSTNLFILHLIIYINFNIYFIFLILLQNTPKRRLCNNY